MRLKIGVLPAPIDFQAGGILGLSMLDPVANLINIGTGGIPGIGIHHVAIVSRHAGTTLVYESTTAERLPCHYTGKITPGVSAHSLAEWISWFKGRKTKIWYYGLRAPLYTDEEMRLDAWLYNQIGRPYDMAGASRAGGWITNALFALMHGEDLSSLFCSELCAAGLIHTGRLLTNDASRWSPNKLCRFGVRRGLLNSPVRVL